jgi:cytochrome c peroxidase
MIMKTHRFKSLSFVLGLAVLAFACKKQIEYNQTEVLNVAPVLPAEPYDYFDKHEVNADLATLGRVLFFDKNLSVNNTTSCGTCHLQKHAFASNKRFDKGFDGQNLTRNTPSIQGIRGFESRDFNNPELAGRPNQKNQLPTLLFWDGRQTNLAEMVLNPIVNHREMSVPDFNVLIAKLEKLDYYQPLFEKAYGNSSIDMERIAFAMEAFIQCLNNPAPPRNFPVNHNGASKPPVPMVVDEDANLTQLERHGKFLFHNKYNCATCHDSQRRVDPMGNVIDFIGSPNSNEFPSNAVTFDGGGGSGNPYATVTSPEFMFNIGLDLNYRDKGRSTITRSTAHEGSFKTPTLRNISLTAPYMHDGRFATLEEVVDHYSDNIVPHQNLSIHFKNADGSLRKLNISPAEKVALVAFLKTLVDEDFISNPMYSDPFGYN